MEEGTVETRGHAFFITGTGTDVGKTVASAGLLRRLSHYGRGIAIKPVQTGCVYKQGIWQSPDLQVWHAASSTLSVPPELYVHVHLRHPASPHLAAELEQTDIDEEGLTSFVLKKRRTHPWIIVEGAGGVLVPITRRFLMVDLMRRLNFHVILVIDNRLGAINNALLSIRLLRQADIPLLGVVFNEGTPCLDEMEAVIRKDNVTTVCDLGSVPVLAQISHIPAFSPDRPDAWGAIDDAWRDFSCPVQTS